jgi:pimeloyl-ACP methyl ester carboxylesterase
LNVEEECMSPETTAPPSAALSLPTGEDDAAIAATLVAEPTTPGPRSVCFAFPGGGYTRAYYDLHHAELEGESQAEFHAGRGIVFVACDPFGGADSTPLPPERLSLESTADACDAAVGAALDGLRDGTLVDWLAPLDVGACFALGHSLGGMQLLAQQARHPRFDAIGILGWSAIHTVMPGTSGALAPHHDGESLEDAWAGPMVDELAHLRYAYHWDDVSPVLVREDMGVGFPTRTAQTLPPWISRTFPPFAAICLAAGVVAREAAAISVPVFVGAGERDVVPDVRREAAAYPSSRDITLFELPRSAHMHNFSPQRQLLWERLQVWFEGLS